MFEKWRKKKQKKRSDDEEEQTDSGQSCFLDLILTREFKFLSRAVLCLRVSDATAQVDENELRVWICSRLGHSLASLWPRRMRAQTCPSFVCVCLASGQRILQAGLIMGRSGRPNGEVGGAASEY